jgi:ATP-binding cassette, subfamily B, bacterial
MQVLIRFYDIHKGQILIDGVNIQSLSLKDLRGNFGYVSQEPAVFADTIYNNIIYGNPDASRDEVISAAKAAAAYQFIQKLPNGFDTFLGERGVKLSGGQKQRITIARAILKNPKILLLDEATSSLDSKNELIVQNALEQLMQNRTTIIIAHRLSSIIKANEILFLKDGMIIAKGTHKELMHSNPEYIKHFALVATNNKQKMPSLQD